jgi:hypothetical protein
LFTVTGRISRSTLVLTICSATSRSALKKYILANHKPAASSTAFDNQFNKAMRLGVEKGEFAQPKGKLISNVSHISPLFFIQATLCLEFPMRRFLL